ncbi:DEAD/DEAH box helicase family protein [Vibrio breoganii]
MKNKLYIHEHPPGSGKTFAMTNLIKQSDCRVVFAVPTLKLVYEIERTLDDCMVINNEIAKAQGQSVSEYLFHNKECIDETRVILTTHSTLLRHAEYFGDRTLIIDELPLEILQFKSIWTTQADAALLDLIMSSREQVEKRLGEYKQGSIELSDDKAELLEAYLSSEFALERSQGKEKVGYHYAYYTDPKKFERFSQIHLMAATVKDTIPYLYFTKLCGYEAGTSCDDEFLVRGNQMDNRVTIYPLAVYVDSERDFISREVLEKHFDSMVNIVQGSVDDDIITITNKERQKALREPLELIPTKAHGLNAYKHKTTAAVIYSANPNPYQIPFMEKCSCALGYDKNYLTNAYVNQNVLDVVYQAVTRTCIRVPDDKRDCVFFVPDMRAANFLMERLPNASIDESKAIRLIDEVGAPKGNTNGQGNKGKGCSVIRALGGCRKKAGRLVKKFEKANGFKPDANEPKHMLRLKKASAMGRVPKDFNFDVSQNL